MPDIIQLLPDHVANQIAAGEVVQRPASVVKELLENAIDAGATDIKLIIKEAGKNLIQVIDNGKGMTDTDARLSFERHATSKIRKAEDLFDLHTKGFRGEALASIAAIAQVEMKTKTEEAELGTQIKIDGGDFISQENVSASAGTSISVKNLFFNIPARRNFLKSNTIETRHIVNEFQRVSLAHPQITFSMYHNENDVYNLLESNLRQRIVSVFGKKTNEKLVPINETTDVVTVTGFVAKPEFAKKKRGEQFFFVNDRFIKNSYLNHAVTSAFESLLTQGSYPSYFLYLTVPTKSIDINIHPTKTEVKFEDEKTIYAILRSTIKHSLGQYNVAPVLDFERQSSFDTPYDFKGKPVGTPQIQVDPDFNPFKTESTSTSTSSSSSSSSPSRSHSYKPSFNTESWEGLYAGLETQDISIEQPTEPETLFSDEQSQETTHGGSTYQIHKKYIVSSIKSGIVYINQHLAHQRILYEEFLQNITVKDAMSQQLLFPLDISFNKSDIVLIKEIQDDLISVGFDFGEFTEDSVNIIGIPVNTSESQIVIILEQLLEDIKNDVPDSSYSQHDVMAKSLAKSLAIKTGTHLDQKEQEKLVDELFSCKQPDVSPFGKTTFITVTLNDIDKQFNR